ncbi:Protein WHT-7 a [Aphelenchoides avenae]|nr:Protein WHT-7 a [Aphelenchus avenae]
METGLRAKLVEHDEIALSMDAECEMDSVQNTIDFHEKFCKHPERYEKALSTTTVVPSMRLTWNALTVKPRDMRKKRLLPRLTSLFSPEPSFKRDFVLHDVFGVAEPGQVLALMGSSGAGKTTLLNVLTQRNLSTVKVEGSVRLNGLPVKKQVLRRISAYVQQDDLFIGTMTVLEHLRFVALLRMGKGYTKSERERRIRTVMTDLGLTGSANTLIGNPHGILTSPPLLFCDEPTSGLDAFLAQQVLKQLAQRKGMTIVLTIHQPSSQVFAMFDKICLLVEGLVAFLGSTEQATEMWSRMGSPLPENFNPGDHFISTLAIEGGKERKSFARIQRICDTFLSTEYGKQFLEESLGSSAGTRRSSATSDSSESEFLVRPQKARRTEEQVEKFKSTWCQQFAALTKRSFLVTMREPMVLRVRLFQTIIIALLFGMVYFNTQVAQTTIMNINGLLFQCVANMSFMFQFAAVTLFCNELPVFLREHQSNLYRTDTYFLSKNVAEVIQYIIYPVVFSAIVYWMSGFVREFDAFLIFTAICILTANVAVSIAYAASCIFGKQSVTLAIMPIFVIPLLAFGGFYINQATLPPYFYPIKYLSYFGYAYEAVAINQWTRIGEIPGCKNSTATTPSGPRCYPTGADVLDSLSFRPENLLFNILIMLGMIFVLRFIGFVALYIRANTKK